MKKLLARVGVLMVVFTASFAVSNLVGAGEKQKITYTKNARQVFAETKINPGGASGRELAQMIYLDSMATGSGWDVLEERGINQDDQIDGSGKHKGVAVDIMKNGDTLFQVYAGTHKTTVKEGGAWEVNYQGTMDFKGGHGQVQECKGKGYLHGEDHCRQFYGNGRRRVGAIDAPYSVVACRWTRGGYVTNCPTTQSSRLHWSSVDSGNLCPLSTSGLRQPQNMALQEIKKEESCAKHL